MGLEESPRRPAGISVPSRRDRLLRKLTEGVGGPLGAHAAPGRVRPVIFTVERVLILMTTTAAVLAILIKAPCRDSGWVRPDQFYRACYSDWTEAFQFQGLGSGIFPFTEGSPFEGPVLLGALAGILTLLVPVSAAGLVQTEALVRYFDVNALLAVAAWIGTVVATMRLASRRPWDAALVAVAPIAILTAASGWTLIPVAFSVFGLLSFARNRFVIAGILLGLGTGFSAHLLLAYAAVVLLAVRTGRARPAIVTGLSLAATSVLTSLPFGRRWNSAFPWDYDPAALNVTSSLVSGFNLLAGRVGLQPLSDAAVGITAVVSFLVLTGLVALLVLKAPRRPRLPQVVLLLVGVLVLVIPNYRPELTLWLLPFVALSYVDWRVFLTWQVTEALHWWAFWMVVARDASSGAASNNIDNLYYVAAVVARLVVTGFILYRVAGHILEPDTDPVRRLSIDDPAGGPFSGAPDRDGAPERTGDTPVGWNASSSSPKNPAPKDPQ